MISKGCVVKYVGGNNRVKPIAYNKVYLVTKTPYKAWLSTSDEPQVLDIFVKNEVLTVQCGDVEKVQ